MGKKTTLKPLEGGDVSEKARMRFINRRYTSWDKLRTDVQIRDIDMQDEII